jgi:hypothetical protein
LRRSNAWQGVRLRETIPFSYEYWGRKMSKSLAEQLLKAGLGDAKKLKNIKKEQHKERVQAGKQGKVTLESTVLAEQTRQAQIARDRELNLQKKIEAEKKALAAQVKQIIELNSISYKGEQAFNFTDGTLVKRLYVNATIHQQLVKGLIAIAKLGEQYHLVPIQVAEKVLQRLPEAVILQNKQDESAPEDDPYADFKIPDDLMW